MRAIIGYEGLYKIDEYGNIQSLPIKYKRGGVIKTHVNKHGYVVAYLSKNNVVKTVKVHRLVATAFIPNPFNYQKVNHKDGIKTNNFYENLEWGTQKHNIQHAFATGLSNQSGFKNNAGKIKDIGTLRAIISEWNTGLVSQTYLAKKYGVSQGTISNIIKGKSYGLIEAGIAIDKTTLK